MNNRSKALDSLAGEIKDCDDIIRSLRDALLAMEQKRTGLYEKILALV